MYVCACAGVFRRTSGGQDYWIGLYKKKAVAADDCYWLDGNPSTFRKWLASASEPDTESKCIRMVSGGHYRDIDCDNQYRYICKMDKGIYLPMTRFGCSLFFALSYVDENLSQ